MTRFDRDTAVQPLAPGRYAARMDPGWWIIAGPNGGYMAAILLRAMQDTVGEPERAPRSLTVHYTRRPEGEAAEVETRVERAGRSLSTVTARLVQGDRLVAHAVAAFSRPRPGFELQGAAFPEVTPLGQAPRRERPARDGADIPFHDRFEIRWASAETPWSGARHARSAAWIRPAEPHAADAPLLATVADALPPAVFAVARDGDEIGPVPTIDLTVHFRAPLPPPGHAPGDFLLACFGTRMVSDGFLEEDGEIWTPDGRLLAQSRQLAILA